MIFLVVCGVNQINNKNPSELTFLVFLAFVSCFLCPVVLLSFSPGLRLFEVSDICRLDPTTDTGARNERHACVVYTGPTAGLEIIHGVVDRLFELLNVRPELVTEKQSMSRGEIKEMEESKSDKPTTSGEPIQRYILQEQDNATYFPSRSANILIDMGDGSPPVKIGEMGVLHPDVLTKFQLGYPVSCMEIDLEMFVDITD
jgi:phenylalanyl-tRNA synthetase beta chain